MTGPYDLPDTCRFCTADGEQPVFAVHPEHGPLCRQHAIYAALTQGGGDEPRSRRILYEHVAAGRVVVRNDSCEMGTPEFATTPAGVAYALGAIANWPREQAA